MGRRCLCKIKPVRVTTAKNGTLPFTTAINKAGKWEQLQRRASGTSTKLLQGRRINTRFSSYYLSAACLLSLYLSLSPPLHLPTINHRAIHQSSIHSSLPQRKRTRPSTDSQTTAIKHASQRHYQCPHSTGEANKRQEKIHWHQRTGASIPITHIHNRIHISCPSPPPRPKTTTTRAAPARKTDSIINTNTPRTPPSPLCAVNPYGGIAAVVATAQCLRSLHLPAATRQAQQSRSPRPTPRNLSSLVTAAAARHVC